MYSTGYIIQDALVRSLELLVAGRQLLARVTENTPHPLQLLAGLQLLRPELLAGQEEGGQLCRTRLGGGRQSC